MQHHTDMTLREPLKFWVKHLLSVISSPHQLSPPSLPPALLPLSRQDFPLHHSSLLQLTEKQTPSVTDSRRPQREKQSFLKSRHCTNLDCSFLHLQPSPPPPPLPLPLPPPLRRAEVHLSFCTLLQASLGSSSAQQTGKQISCTSQAQTQESATQDLSGAPQCCILILK